MSGEKHMLNRELREFLISEVEVSEESVELLPNLQKLSSGGQKAVINYCRGGTYAASYVAGFGAEAVKEKIALKGRSVHNAAGGFFQHQIVQAAIREYRALQRSQADGVREALVDSLLYASFYDPAEAFDKKGNMLPIKEIPEDLRKCITRYTTNKYGSSVEFVDRLKAKAMLAELLGISQSNQGLTVTIDLGDSPDMAPRSPQNDTTSSLTLDMTPDTAQ